MNRSALKFKLPRSGSSCSTGRISHSDVSSRRKRLGFTLVELMVTLTILAILLSLAAPSFATLVASNRITTETNDLTGALGLARAEAIRRAQAVTVRSDDTDNYAKGWHVFPDGDADGAPANPVTSTDGETLRVASAFSGTATITRVTRSAPPAPFTYSTTTATDRRYVTFTSRGAINATAAAFFRICDPSHPTVKGRIVQVNVVGKITLDDTNATCS